MDTTEKKSRLFSLIGRINDNRTLDAIYTLLSNSVKSEEDWWDTISNEEKAAIEEGVRQLDNGEGIPHEQVMANMKERYPQLFQ